VRLILALLVALALVGCSRQPVYRLQLLGSHGTLATFTDQGMCQGTIKAYHAEARSLRQEPAPWVCMPGFQ